MLIATAAAALVMFAGDAAATDPAGGATSPAPPEAASGPTTVSTVTVNKPKRECRKVRVTGARNARLVCTTVDGEPPADTLGVRSLSPTMHSGDQGNLNQAPRD